MAQNSTVSKEAYTRDSSANNSNEKEWKGSSDYKDQDFPCSTSGNISSKGEEQKF